MNTFYAGSQLKLVKHHIDEINEEAFSYKYTLIEADGILDKLESIVYEIKFEASSSGGTISKMTSKYNTKGDIVLSDEEIKAGKERALGMYKVVEAYLLQNPDAYA